MTPKILSLSEVCNLPNDSWVSGFRATCLSIETKQAKATGKNFWKVEWTDRDGLRMGSTLFTAPKFRQGDEVEFAGLGLKYVDGQYGKEIKIQGDKWTCIAHGAQRTAAPEPVREGEGDFSPQVPANPPNRPAEALKPVYGATVGMAMNLAVETYTKGLDHEAIADMLASEAFHDAIHQIASDLIRTAARLERGELAPATKDKNPY